MPRLALAVAEVASPDAPAGPCGCREGARSVVVTCKVGEPRVALDQAPLLLTEALDVSTDCSLPAQFRLPVIRKGRELHADGEGSLLDLAQAHVGPRRCELARSSERAGEQSCTERFPPQD